jgi:type I restriction enzyme M protein
MATNHFEKLNQLEASLWEAADQLRANSKQASSEYFMPVLGVIFLRHATNRYEVARREIEEDLAAGRMKRTPAQEDFLKRRALMLPEVARYDYLLQLPKHADLGAALKTAMEKIEEGFAPLKDQLPKDYGKLDNTLLEDLLRIFNREALRTAPGDVFGRIYEYFLMKFAVQEAYDKGEFFTPPSLVQTIVNVIEPDHGDVFDPACGSGGMFVQSSHFVEGLGLETSQRVTFYGQEKTATTIRLARMNLAVHALEGNIREANTFYQDVHNLFEKCDFVMANPPFNVDMVDEEKVKDDRRLPFGLPGVNKQKKVSNANYLWISYFYSYLNEKGRAGFVMSSQASSAGSKEAEVRRKLIETGTVDVMIAIRSNFFYTRTVPCELWHLDRGKPEQRRDQVLMIDARNIYRKVTRKIYDFSPEQLANLSAIVWLYRGQTGRFLDLVQRYLNRTIAESAGIAALAADFRKSCEALAEATSPFLDTVPNDSPLCHMRKEHDEAGQACFEALDRWTARLVREWGQPCDDKLAGQKRLLGELGNLAGACRDLVKGVDAVCRLATRVVDAAEKDGGARALDDWDSRAIGRLEKEVEAARTYLVERLKQTAYFHHQAEWLLSRFPDGKFVPVPGLCRVVTREEIEAGGWSLTPGRYVGVAPPEVDEDFDFEQALRDIRVELADLNEEAARLGDGIQKNFEELDV